MDIGLVRKSDRPLTDNEKQAMATVCFEMFDGFTDDDKKNWRRFWTRLFKLECGEMAKFSYSIIRSYKFHKKYFALLNFAYDNWEPDRKRKSYKGMPVQKNFDIFRHDVTIMSGYYSQSFGIDGSLKLIPMSISFAKMSQEQFEELYSKTVDVILQKILVNYGSRQDIDAVVEKMIHFF